MSILNSSGSDQGQGYATWKHPHHRSLESWRIEADKWKEFTGILTEETRGKLLTSCFLKATREI